MSLSTYEPKDDSQQYASVRRFVGHVQLKGLAPRTVEAYVCMIRHVARWSGDDPEKLDEEQVREFFLHGINDRHWAPQSLRQCRAALKAFYCEMLGHPWSLLLMIRVKAKDVLPEVLSREEVRRLLGAVREERFAVPLKLVYECGLRLGEVVRVEVKDIHRASGRLQVRQGKGRKDCPLFQSGPAECTMAPPPS